MAKKITKTDRFEQISELLCRCAKEGMLTEVEHKELADFVAHEKELLSKKNSSGERKPTVQQKSNADLKSMIHDFLVVDGKQTISDLMPKLTSTEEITHGRVTALLTQLRNEGKVEREKKGSKTYFSAVTEG